MQGPLHAKKLAVNCKKDDGRSSVVLAKPCYGIGVSQIDFDLVRITAMLTDVAQW